jgi:polysaccharide export outer membrane protein
MEGLPRRSPSWALLWGVVLTACSTSAGCHLLEHPDDLAAPPPTEKAKVTLDDYVIEPPDILLLDSLSAVPLPPYHIATLDSLVIYVPNAPQTDPISGLYPVEVDGTVNLGPTYGTVRLVGLTLEEAKTAIETQIKGILKEPPKVTVSLGQIRANQQIRGEHLVGPDGTVNLGIYGTVMVTGLTVSEARKVLEAHLSQFLQKPEVSVRVLAYNSKVYYVILDLGGRGQQLVRLPVTGNDTVLDAISQINGLTAVSSQQHIWVKRPGVNGAPDHILPVDWVGITRGDGHADTNYQLFAGDRLYVGAQPLVTADNVIARIISPMERILGFTLLGSGTIFSIEQIKVGGQVGAAGASP